VLIGYEAGRTKPGEREIRLLCDALKVTPNKLIYGREEPFQSDETLARLGINAEEIQMGHVIVLFNMLNGEERRALLTIIYAILEARKGRKEMQQATEAMKVFGEFLPEVMTQLGAHIENIAPDALAKLESHAKEKFARFAEKEPSPTKRKRR
jgi:hypothetical protein